ncbi:hypothetical protein T492DRAFT_1108929 [Pavlovales sp. CCMP2436]|nr:hypothetical protein T492DRAFT_1108929 [Pavlovales sp. CCMP2436]
MVFVFRFRFFVCVRLSFLRVFFESETSFFPFFSLLACGTPNTLPLPLHLCVSRWRFMARTSRPLRRIRCSL